VPTASAAVEAPASAVMPAAIPAAPEEPPAVMPAVVTTVMPAVTAAGLGSAVVVILAAERALPPGPRPAAGTADGRHCGPDEHQRDHSHDRVRKDAHGMPPHCRRPAVGQYGSWPMPRPPS